MNEDSGSEILERFRAWLNDMRQGEFLSRELFLAVFSVSVYELNRCGRKDEVDQLFRHMKKYIDHTEKIPANALETIVIH